MGVDVNVRLDLPPHVQRQLDRIEGKLDRIYRSEVVVQEEIDALLVQVQANTDAEASMDTLLVDIHDRLVAAQGDPAKVQAAIDLLETNRQRMIAATLANTVAEPPPANPPPFIPPPNPPPAEPPVVEPPAPPPAEPPVENPEPLPEPPPIT